MNLNLEQIKSITTGAVRIEEKDGRFCFFRFTKEEEELYKIRRTDFYVRSFTTSGVKLYFKTNSKKIFIKADAIPGSSRNYFSFDVFVNGKFHDSLENFSDANLPESYTTVSLPIGSFSKSFDLGDGLKTVEIYLPWSVKAEIEELIIDDGAVIEPVKSKGKLLAYGDSITHGYDALYSANKYITRLANALHYDEYNKAIGGEIFFPDLAQIKQPFTPDIITVAYGTNDWSNTNRDTFKTNCKAFYENLANNYPDTPIFAITPIWRKEILTETRPFGEFSLVEEEIREATKNLKNVTVIRGFDFVPKEEKYFADLRLHPNDEGFEYYAKSLYEMIAR